MLQNIGVASAVVWTAPIVTSIGAKAFAGASDICNGRDWNCGDTIVQCGSSGPLQMCICDVDTSGKKVCWEDFFCGGPTCSSNAECGGGVCVTSCCGQTCAPLCTNSGSPKGAPRSGQRASGL